MPRPDTGATTGTSQPASGTPNPGLGIPPEAFDFYRRLAADNSRAFWEANRAVYERSVREPLSAVCDALSAEFGPARLFRPQRDVRFSPDKSPIKDHQGAFTTASDAATRQVAAGTHYVQVSAAGLMVGGGLPMASPDQTARLRAALLTPAGLALAGLVDDLRGAGFEFEGQTVKTRPRGVPADALPTDDPRWDLLRHKTLIATRRWSAAPWMSTPEVVDRIATAWRRLTPMLGWITEQVGPPRATDRAR